MQSARMRLSDERPRNKCHDAFSHDTRQESLGTGVHDLEVR